MNFSTMPVATKVSGGLIKVLLLFGICKNFGSYSLGTGSLQVQTTLILQTSSGRPISKKQRVLWSIRCTAEGAQVVKKSTLNDCDITNTISYA